MRKPYRDPYISNLLTGDEVIGNDKEYTLSTHEKQQEFAKKRSMNTTEEYDVVIDTLQKQIDVLWKMTQSNMNSDMFNIMDQIRLEQIDQLNAAIKLWRERNESR